jgi:hypothetical protein
LSIGWHVLKQHFGHCFPYALAPPLVALALLQRTPVEDLGFATRLLLGIVGTLAYLALKGATAAYYVRHHGVAIPEGEIYVPTTPDDHTALPSIGAPTLQARVGR